MEKTIKPKKEKRQGQREEDSKLTKLIEDQKKQKV
jgi:hypothetical protein